MNAFALAIIITIIVQCTKIPYIGPVIFYFFTFVFFGGLLSIVGIFLHVVFIQ